MDNVSNPALVLIADHSEEFFNQIQDALAATDYAFVYAKDGEEAMALRELLKSEIEFAVVDLELTAPGGIDLIGRFARHGLKPRKIIATTSIYPEALLADVKDLGVDAVVRKPITPRAWLNLLNDLHRRPEQGGATAAAKRPHHEQRIRLPWLTDRSLRRPAFQSLTSTLAVMCMALIPFAMVGLRESHMN